MLLTMQQDGLKIGLFSGKSVVYVYVIAGYNYLLNVCCWLKIGLSHDQDWKGNSTDAKYNCLFFRKTIKNE